MSGTDKTPNGQDENQETPADNTASAPEGGRDESGTEEASGQEASGPRDLEKEADNILELAGADKSYEELLDENAQLKDRVLRAMAEAENLRRRAQREKEDAAKYAISNFARDLLEVQDNLTRALAAITPEERVAGGDVLTTLFEGVEMTQRGLHAAFERHKIQILHPAGEKFDPNFHQAVAEIPGTDHAHGTVVDVMQTGYLIGERLLRPAMVTVSKGGSSGDNPGDKVDTNA